MLYFITNNKNKFDEVREIMKPIKIKQLSIDLPEIQEIDARKIIYEKLDIAIRLMKDGKFKLNREDHFIVEDTSLYVDAMKGLPGPLIKWFLKTIGNEGISKIALAFRNGCKGQVKTVIGYYDGQTIDFFEGTVEGKIVEPRGKTNFGWDPIFQPKGHEKTFALMDRKQKNKISMRKIALEKLKDFLKRK